MRSWDAYEKASKKGPLQLGLIVISTCVALFLVLWTIGYLFGWFGEVAQITQEEFGPHSMLQKYEWFKDAASQLDKKRADIIVYQSRISTMKSDYVNIPRKDWPRSDREQSNLWSTEVAGVISTIVGAAVSTAMTIFVRRAVKQGTDQGSGFSMLGYKFQMFLAGFMGGKAETPFPEGTFKTKKQIQDLKALPKVAWMAGHSLGKDIDTTDDFFKGIKESYTKEREFLKTKIVDKIPYKKALKIISKQMGYPVEKTHGMIGDVVEGSIGGFLAVIVTLLEMVYKSIRNLATMMVFGVDRLIKAIRFPIVSVYPELKKYLPTLSEIIYGESEKDRAERLKRENKDYVIPLEPLVPTPKEVNKSQIPETKINDNIYINPDLLKKYGISIQDIQKTTQPSETPIKSEPHEVIQELIERIKILTQNAPKNSESRKLIQEIIAVIEMLTQNAKKREQELMEQETKKLRESQLPEEKQEESYLDRAKRLNKEYKEGEMPPREVLEQNRLYQFGWGARELFNLNEKMVKILEEMNERDKVREARDVD